MFTVVEGSPKPLWVPVDYTSAVTLYIGQIVHGGIEHGTPALSGLGAIGSGDNAADHDDMNIPFGIVSGLQSRSGMTWSSTYLTDGNTSVNTQAGLLARDFSGQEGMISKNDPIVAVQISRIMGTETVLRGSIRHGALTTYPTEVTVTTGSADGLTFVAATSGITSPIALNATTYCRSGANRGIYRVTSTTSATTRTLLIPFPADITAGDIFVQVPIKVGTCFTQFDSLSMYINSSVSANNDNYIVNCWELDLKVEGKENATFSFTGDHFCASRG